MWNTIVVDQRIGGTNIYGPHNYWGAIFIGAPILVSPISIVVQNSGAPITGHKFIFEAI